MDNSTKKRPLTEEELQYFADHLSEISEDGVEFSDYDDDFEDIPPTYDGHADENDMFDLGEMPMIILPDFSSDALPLDGKQFDNSTVPSSSEQLSADNGATCSVSQSNKYQNVLCESTQQNILTDEKLKQKADKIRLNQSATTRKRKNEEINDDGRAQKKKSAGSKKELEKFCRSWSGRKAT
nr:unnamed protein product [Callosobruchus analis]